MNTTAAIIAIVLSVLIPIILATALIIKTARDGSLGEDVDYVRYIIRTSLARRKYNAIRNH